MDGLLFGFIDNAVLLVGAYTGFEVEKILPKRFQVGVGAIAGAGIGNTVSDAACALIDPALFSMAGGITIGCLIPLLAIPVLAKLRPLSQ